MGIEIVQWGKDGSRVEAGGTSGQNRSEASRRVKSRPKVLKLCEKKLRKFSKRPMEEEGRAHLLLIDFFLVPVEEGRALLLHLLDDSATGPRHAARGGRTGANEEEGLRGPEDLTGLVLPRGCSFPLFPLQETFDCVSDV